MNKIFSIFIVLIIIALGIFLYIQNKHNNKNIMTNSQNSDYKITPIEHASLMIEWSGKVIYADPVGDSSLFASLPRPDLILLTDIHQDHLNVDTLNQVAKESTIIVAPQAVFDEIINKINIGTIVIMKNGDKSTEEGFNLEAIPMYNLPGPSAVYHPRGRGNGYVIQFSDKRIYISGDSAGIPEMRNLKNIDWAFVCMNLPYTMPPEEAASAVLDMNPKHVTPYHYRQSQTKDYADINKFKSLVNAGNLNIEVDLMNFYPNK